MSVTIRFIANDSDISRSSILLERKHKNFHLSEAEQDTLKQLKQMPIASLHTEAASVATTLYRSAQQLRLKMEKEVLSSYKLSWTAFSILYDLWVWDKLEMRKLAQLSGISTATASNVTNTLEKKKLCFRSTDKRDRRLVFVTITEEGKKAIEELYPDFHKGEIELVAGLSNDEQKTLSALLKKVADNLTT